LAKGTKKASKRGINEEKRRKWLMARAMADGDG